MLSPSIEQVAALVIRPQVCLVTYIWLSDPQTMPMLGWQLVREQSTAMVLRETIPMPQRGSRTGGIAGRGSRNRLRTSYRERHSYNEDIYIRGSA